MNINDITIGDAKTIAALVNPNNPNAAPISVGDVFDLGPQQIVVLDRGFVYTGRATIGRDFVTISNAKNIRVWGTSKGLGELVNGPTSSTKSDEVGTIIAPLRSVIHIIKCNRTW